MDINIEPYIKPRSNRYAHVDCATAAKNQKTKEEQDKENLEIYIKSLFNIKQLSPKINKQIKDYIEKNEYTYSGILKTLQYFFEIRGNDIDKANEGIGIVPFVYYEARSYYKKLWEVQQKNQEKRIETIVLPAKEIHISNPRKQRIFRGPQKFTFLEQEVT